MQGRIQTMTGSEIMEAQFPRHREIVEQLLPQGLHIFSGMSKVGKSWLLLQLCMKVAAGERFWNRRTEQGKVLYFTLEDRMDRVRERALTLRDTIPENLSVSCLAPTLTDGFAKRLREYLRSEPETNLVVIDTLMQAVIGYMKRAGAYCGTAMELTECLGLSLRPNVLSGKLNRYAEELRKIGITVERSRTGQNRTLHLRYDTPNSAGAA